MNTFEKSVKKVNDLVKNNKIDSAEFARLGLSDLRWADARPTGMPNRKIRKGAIYQFDFGKNFVPEMSYEHRGLVIGKNKSLLYVLPIFTYREKAHKKDLYQKETPEGRQRNLYLLPAANYNFINHDSILKLDDLRTVSTKRVLYKQPHGFIKPGSDVYKEIEWLTFSRYFPQFNYELSRLREKVKSLEDKT